MEHPIAPPRPLWARCRAGLLQGQHPPHYRRPAPRACHVSSSRAYHRSFAGSIALIAPGKAPMASVVKAALRSLRRGDATARGSTLPCSPSARRRACSWQGQHPPHHRAPTPRARHLSRSTPQSRSFSGSSEPVAPGAALIASIVKGRGSSTSTSTAGRGAAHHACASPPSQSAYRRGRLWQGPIPRIIAGQRRRRAT